jgi:iron complex outermembrane recepter protein
MRILRVAAAILLLAAMAFGQIPAQEDLDTKSKRSPVHDGLEVREVRESAAKDAGEALATLDGVSKVRKGAIANDIVLRGFQGSDLNVLVDGMRIFGACPSNMDPAAFHVDFAEVERIELTKGSFDVTNQGSLGGAVNIVRRRPGPGLRITPALQTGSFGYFNPSLVMSAGNEAVELLVGYSYRQSGSFRAGNGARMTSFASYCPEHAADDAFRIHTGWTNLRFSPALHQSGELSYTRQHGADVLYPYLQMDSPYDIADRLGANYEFRGLGLRGLRKIRLQSYYSTVRHWMTDEQRQSSLTGLDRFSMASFARTRAAGGRANVEWSRDISAGVEVYQRNWDAVNSFRMPAMVLDQNILPNVNMTVAGAYMDFERSITDRLRLGAGARIDSANSYVRSPSVNLNLFEAYKGASRLSRRDTNASANARMTLGLSKSWEVFTGAGSTVRLPDPQERYFNHRRMGSDWVGSPDLAPTRNTEGTAGLNFRRSGVFFKALAFHSYLSNFVVVHNQRRVQMLPGVMNLTARSYENVDARMYGGEVSYGVSLRSRWLFSGGLSYTRATKDAEPERGIFDRDVAEIPPLRTRASARYGTRRWFAQAGVLAVRRQRRVDSDLGEVPTPGYATAEVKLGLHLSRLNLTCGIDNLFDRFYYEHLSFQRDPFRSGIRVPEPGRTVYLNISHRF